MTAAAAGAQVHTEAVRIGKVVREAGIKAE
jgi:hypothetical protein